MGDAAGPLDDIARRCFEAEVEAEQAARKAKRATRKAERSGETGEERSDLFYGCWGCLGLLGGFMLLTTLVSEPRLGIMLLVFGIGLLAFRARVQRGRLGVKRVARRRLMAFRAGEPQAVLDAHRFAVEYFRAQIDLHRTRTLGSDSEWGRARNSLEGALQEARRSVSYWDLRAGDGEGNELARQQLEVATQLRDKLSRALQKLDGRAEILLQFYNDCEARLAVMDGYNQDLAETQRLEHLSNRADLVIAEAEGTLAGIGRQFVLEAQAVGRALGGLTEMQVRSLAGEAPLDNIEHFADQIIESSEWEERAVRELDESLAR